MKKTNRFLGPYEYIQLFERNRVELPNKMNKNKKEIVHIKELKKPPVVSESPSPLPTE